MITLSCRSAHAVLPLALVLAGGCESPPVADSDLKPVDEPAVASLALADSSAWRPANSGIEGADVHALAIDPLAPRTLYASTFTGGLYKTVDGARTWRLTGAGLPRAPGAIAVHPRRAGIVYVAAATGVYKSTDAGRNFREPTQPHGPLFAPLVIAPSDPSVLYVRGPSGYLLRSEDAGSTWTFTSRQLAWFAVHARDAGIVYGVTDTGEVYKTSDRGDRFTRLGVDLPTSPPGGAHTIALDPGHPDTVYVGIAGHGLYRSRDAGTQFEPIGTDVARGQAYRAIVVAPRDPRRILLAASVQPRAGGLFVSDDEGATFAKAGFAEAPLDVFFDPRDDRNVYLASTDGTHKSSDRGRTFGRSIAGFHAMGIGRIVTASRIPGALVAAGKHVLCRSSDWGARWSCSNTLAEASVSGLVGDATRSRSAYVGFRMPDRRVPSPTDPTLISVRPQPGTLFATDDAGHTWQEITGDIGPYATLTPLAVAPDAGDLYVLARGRITEHAIESDLRLFRSADRGRTWHALTVPSGLSEVFLATSRAQLFTASELGGLSASQDGGATWARVAIDTLAITALAVDPRDRQTLYASARVSSPPAPLSGGLRKSIDGGRTWFVPYAPLDQVDVRGVAVSPTDGRLYVLSSALGPEQPVLTSIDGGSTFIAAGSGLWPNVVSTLVPDPFHACAAYAGTVGQGVFATQRAGGTCAF